MPPLKLAAALKKVNLPCEQARVSMDHVRESCDFTLAEPPRPRQIASVQTAEKLDRNTGKAIAMSQADAVKTIRLLHTGMEARYTRIHTDMEAGFAVLGATFTRQMGVLQNTRLIKRSLLMTGLFGWLATLQWLSP